MGPLVLAYLVSVLPWLVLGFSVLPLLCRERAPHLYKLIYQVGILGLSNNPA